MNIDRMILAMAGTMVLAGLVLGVWADPYWLLLPAFVGANQIQAAFTGFCPAARLLKRLGVPAGNAF